MSYLLQLGEFSVGRYKIRFAHFAQGSWHAQGRWMHLLVTNRRLLLLPENPQQKDIYPMVIPAANIVQVWSMGLGKRDGGVIELKGGELLYFFVEMSQSTHLTRDVRALLKPALAKAAQAGMGQKRYTN